MPLTAPNTVESDRLLVGLVAESDPPALLQVNGNPEVNFTKEGLLRQRWITKGEPTDVEVHGLLHDEWPSPPHHPVLDNVRT